MNNEEKFKLIEKTIKDAKGDYSIDSDISFKSCYYFNDKCLL